MSTLKVNTVQHNTSGFNNVVQFTDGAGTENGTLCRAWVNFQGTGTVTIRASFNVNSITNNTTEDYTVNFSNAMSDANYASCITAFHTTTAGSNSFTTYAAYGGVSQTTSSVRMSGMSGTDGGESRDLAYMAVAVFR